MAKKTADENGGRKIGVLLASSSALRRAGLEVIVKSAASLKLVGSLQGTRTANQRAIELRADVLLVDLEGETSLTMEGPISVPGVALIDKPGPAWAAHAIRSGVKAILARESGAEEIVPAVTAVYAGFVLLDPAVGTEMAEQIRGRTQVDSSSESLTPRELEVLAMLAEGLGNREIASRLGVSDHTIKYHISSILDKLGASTRTEAVTTGLRMGLILL